MARRRKPPHWSELHPAGLKPDAEALLPPDGGETPQDEPGGQGGGKPLPEPAKPPSTRPRPRRPGEYQHLKSDDDGAGDI
jgi:hypothetical protein